MPRTSYRKRFEQDLKEMIESLNLSDPQKKQFLRMRWLEQVVWMEAAANRSRLGYYSLRLVAIVGSVLVPALVSLNISGDVAAFVRWLTFSLSLLVAISVAVEEFFHLGERWRHYRRTVELLKSEGWYYFQKSGPYQDYETHEQAYPVFASQVETISRQEVEVYITQIVREKEKQSET